MSKRSAVGSTLPFSPGDSTMKENLLTPNLDRYVSWASGGFISEILSFPLPYSCTVKNLRVRAVFVSPIHPGEELVTTVVIADAEEKYLDTQLVVKNNCTMDSGLSSSRLGGSFLAARGNLLAIKVRFNSTLR